MRSVDWRTRGGLLGQSPAELAAERRRFFTIANFISLSRVIALPFLLHAISLPPEVGTRRLIAICCFVALTDMLDGLVARALHEVSDAGRVIDPLADKICIGAVAVSLAIHRGLPVWIPAAIIVRDILIVVGSIVLVRRVDFVLPSNQVGRLTTVVLTLTMFSYAIDWLWPQQALLVAGGVLIVVSLIIYVRIGWHILRNLEPR